MPSLKPRSQHVAMLSTTPFGKVVYDSFVIGFEADCTQVFLIRTSQNLKIRIFVRIPFMMRQNKIAHEFQFWYF
ncbi:hypothetical protein HME7025_02330 [Aquirufa nivalisilvae]|uniref:Uncharacterized protein n=1 Tax=Aquirufa nivalisilvae TaxID=2516557 RepID=A0A2S2DXN9_9BACT|nr:hypothetical protein HME7025_02330 [Aquirufa nivalisilvae]